MQLAVKCTVATVASQTAQDRDCKMKCGSKCQVCILVLCAWRPWHASVFRWWCVKNFWRQNWWAPVLMGHMTMMMMVMVIASVLWATKCDKAVATVWHGEGAPGHSLTHPFTGHSTGLRQIQTQIYSGDALPMNPLYYRVNIFHSAHKVDIYDYSVVTLNP